MICSPGNVMAPTKKKVLLLNSIGENQQQINKCCLLEQLVELSMIIVIIRMKNKFLVFPNLLSR